MIAMESLIMFKRNKTAKWLAIKKKKGFLKHVLVWVVSNVELIVKEKE